LLLNASAAAAFWSAFWNASSAKARAAALHRC
jgi:hypothetical protein